MSNKLSSEDRQAPLPRNCAAVQKIPPPRDHAAVPPLAVTVARACELSGFGQTSIWAFIKDGRLAAVRLPGVRRTLVSFESLRRLLEGASTGQRPKRGRGRPEVMKR
jgi:hypothetical protein